MGRVPWLKVFDTLSGLAQMGAQFASRPSPGAAGGAAEPAMPGPGEYEEPTGLRPRPSSGPGGALEARLAGVVVAALKEAFDRDKARMDLERETAEAERARAERALQAELRRQAADRALTQLRLIAIFAGLVVLVAGVLAAWVPGMRAGASAVLLTLGWALAVGALGCVFAAWQQVTVWASATEPPPAGTSSLVQIAPWLLLGSLSAVAASLLFAA